MKIYFVTGNEKKAREAAQIAPNVERISLDLPEIQSMDAQEVLEAKLDAAHKAMPGKTLAVEDVTYSIKGLNGLPGTLVKWFVELIGPDGIYDLVKDKDTTTVVAANIGLVMPDGTRRYFIGEVQGNTVSPGAGGGYHFDNIFIPDGQTIRYSEMSKDEKNAISHRRLAWDKLRSAVEI